MARVASLLDPYFEKDTPQAIREMQARDWADELAEYPQWAIDAAVKWWISADNKDRRKRPMAGDIAARCRVEVGPVQFGQYLLTKPPKKAEPERPEPTPEARERIGEVVSNFLRGKRIGA